MFSFCLKPVFRANGHEKRGFEWSTFSLKLKCFYSKVGGYAPEYVAIRASAQVPILEKSFDVSRKAKNGYLAHIETNAEKGTIDMIYVLSSTTRHKIKYEIYTYDKDLNLINTVQEE